MPKKDTNTLKNMSLEDLWELFPIILTDYKPEYQAWYKTQAAQLTKILGTEKILRMNHIGSTAVVGIPSKPIIDILLEINFKLLTANKLIDLLENHGWILMSKNDASSNYVFNKGYTPDGFAEKVYHLHVRPLGDWDELYFRDYLMQSPKTQLEYTALKESLLRKYKNNRDAYTDSKTQFVKGVNALARKNMPSKYAL